jgi:hypothetical protein
VLVTSHEACISNDLHNLQITTAHSKSMCMSMWSAVTLVDITVAPYWSRRVYFRFQLLALLFSKCLLLRAARLGRVTGKPKMRSFGIIALKIAGSATGDNLCSNKILEENG